jgi:hypothetical protein
MRPAMSGVLIGARMAEMPKFPSDRRTVEVITTIGSTSAYSDAVDFGNFSGMGVYIETAFASGTADVLTLQAAVASEYANVRDSDGNLIQIAKAYAGAWNTIKADAFPYGNVRWAMTTTAGSALAGTVSYNMRLMLKP